MEAVVSAYMYPPIVCFHGTPRQWRDPARGWLEEERQRLVSLLRGAGVTCTERLYFEEQPPSMEAHFGCVEKFDLDLGGGWE